MSRTELLRDSWEKIKKEKSEKKPEAGRPAKPKAAKQGGPKTNRTEHMALRLTKATRREVEKAAYETHRTASNWIETAILWALEEGAVKTRQLVPRPEGE